MSTRREVRQAQHRLRCTISRAQRLAQQCAAITADADKPYVDRESAEKRFWLAIKTAGELENSLDRVEDALR